MPPRRMFPFAPGALHQAIRANDTMPTPTCANRQADGEMRLCAEAIAQKRRWQRRSLRPNARLRTEAIARRAPLQLKQKRYGGKKA